MIFYNINNKCLLYQMNINYYNNKKNNNNKNKFKNKYYNNLY